MACWNRFVYKFQLSWQLESYFVYLLQRQSYCNNQHIKLLYSFKLWQQLYRVLYCNTQFIKNVLSTITFTVTSVSYFIHKVEKLLTWEGTESRNSLQVIIISIQLTVSLHKLPCFKFCVSYYKNLLLVSFKR